MAKIEYHLYDLNLTQIQKELLRLSKEDRITKSTYDSLIQNFNIQLENFCKEYSINFPEYARLGVPILVRGKENVYQSFLFLTLIYIDVFKINSFLNYQYETFTANYYATDKSALIGLIEFITYEQVKNINPSDALQRLEKIMNWVDHERLKTSVSPVKFNNKQIRVNEQYVDKITEILNPYFSDHDRPILTILLNGEPIEGNIVFNEEAKKLLDAFLRIHDNKVIINSKRNLQDWICRYFKYFHNNELNVIASNYAHKIISTKKQPCSDPIKGIVELFS